ncbi:hypothetical protein PH242_04790 [Photorhabdus bodei]|uniref:hypothetical protein n=1 Tax=Photorhabdus bodei TaxID=2029681 RepID=UPI00232DCA63|nr:hypothetical protein [Photorhabdus bodei]MDB6367012.1 hypothetical protein [Photorhabdus bodei]
MMHEEFIIRKINTTNRPEGISAYVRVRNGAETLYLAIKSHIDLLDEIIIVYNQCLDNTEDIIQKLINEYPNKIKGIKYKPIVYPVGSIQHKKLPENSVHSMVNYSNFALAQTKYKWVMILDDDHILPSNLKNKEIILQPNTINFFSGINLSWQDYENKTIGINKIKPFAGNGDHYFFECTDNTYYKKNDICEYLNFGNKRTTYHGIRYYHLKYLKKDFGFTNVLNTNRGKKQLEDIKKAPVVSIPEFQKGIKKVNYLNDRNNYLIDIFLSIPNWFNWKIKFLESIKPEAISVQRIISLFNEIDQLFNKTDIKTIRNNFYDI